MPTSTPSEFAIIGLGKVGSALASQAIEKGYRVAGFTRHGVPDQLIHAGVTPARSIGDLSRRLSPPRVVMLYVPAGPAVDEIIGELETVLCEGDVIIDGGNSYWGDSVRRHQRLRQHGLSFVDLGTSGGVRGARFGGCFMAGGNVETISLIAPILSDLAVEDGWVHAGGPGAGHFVKLVHNGIEFAPKIGPNPGLEATYTEHAFTTSEKPENRSKSWARNQRYLHLDHAIL